MNNNIDYTTVDTNIKRYVMKTKEDFIKSISDFQYVYIFDDGTFTTFNVWGSCIEIGPSCCSWKQGYNFYRTVAKVIHVNRLVTMTNRNPRAYCRLTHSHILEYDGNGTFIIEKEVK